MSWTQFAPWRAAREARSTAGDRLMFGPISARITSASTNLLHVLKGNSPGCRATPATRL